MKIKLIDGGSMKHGEYIRLSLVLPEFENSEIKTITGKTHKTTRLSFSTQFYFTRNPNYGMILFSILGFGLALEFHERYD